MKRFTAEQLRTLSAVVEHHTFEEAALVLHVSASAISQRIKAMEQACGQVLLRRTNPVEPTEPGRVVLRLARQIDQLTADAQQEISGETVRRHVAVAANADSLATWFLDAVASIPWEERIYCDIRREDERHSSALLRSGTVMGVITSDPHPVQGCSVEKLGHERYWTVASPAFLAHYFPGIGEGEVTEQQLASAPLLQYDRKDESMLHDAAVALAKEYGRKPQLQAPRVYIPSSGDYFRAIERGLGWGMIPEQQCADALEQGRLIRLVPGPVDMAMYWQRWTIASSALDTLTDAVRDTAARALRP